MKEPARYYKISYCNGEDIKLYKIYWDIEDRNYRMKTPCSNCLEIECRCFETLENALDFEGYVCSSRCFVLSYAGDDEELDEIIKDMKLTIPLKDLPDSVFNEIVAAMDDDFDSYEMPLGETCPV